MVGEGQRGDEYALPRERGLFRRIGKKPALDSEVQARVALGTAAACRADSSIRIRYSSRRFDEDQ